MERRLIVSVIGNAACWYEKCDPENRKKWDIAYDLGKTLIDNGYRVLTGGGRGVMRAAMAGAHSSKKYKEGDTIAIAPTFDENDVNDFADIVIATGLESFRDPIVANSPVVVAIGGGGGTLREIANAWKQARLVIAMEGVVGWSAELAGKTVDDGNRYDFPEDKIWAAKTAQDVIDIIKKWLPKYDRALNKLSTGESQFKKKRKSNWVGPIITTEIKEMKID